MLLKKKGHGDGRPASIRFCIVDVSEAVLFQQSGDCRDESALPAGISQWRVKRHLIATIDFLIASGQPFLMVPKWPS